MNPIDDLSDEEIIKSIDKIDQKKDWVGKAASPSLAPAVYHLTSDTVAKPLWRSECEGFTMQYIAEHTDIPVPRLLRTVKCVRSTWIVMKYIEGETLDDL